MRLLRECSSDRTEGDRRHSECVRVAALYDIHGNFPALTAVLEEVDELQPDAIVVGGDVASGPMPVETLDALRGRNALFVRGNADRVLTYAEPTTAKPG
jgi:Icc-related predicted phosphoesterase